MTSLTDALAFTLLLAQEEAPRNTGPEFGKASPVGLIIVILLLLATFALVWSMNRQLKKVPESFDTSADADDTGDFGADTRPGGPAEGGPPAAEPGSPDDDTRRKPGG